MSHGHRSLIVLLSVIICAGLIRGQTGVVKSGGQAIPGATIAATQGTTKLTTLTDENGRYAFTGLTAGTWKFRLEMFGFQAAEKEVQVTGPAQFGIAVRVGGTRISPDYGRVREFTGGRADRGGSGERTGGIRTAIG
jgi:Carboxypeptidase regulatory-like domain